jgi:hypothetical protein
VRKGLSSMSERSKVMATHEARRGWNEVKGAVRGSFRSVLLGWTDPISGDRLTVRMRGEDGLLASLTPLGFEELGVDGGPWGQDGARPSLRSVEGRERTEGSAAAG